MIAELLGKLVPSAGILSAEPARPDPAELLANARGELHEAMKARGAAEAQDTAEQRAVTRIEALVAEATEAQQRLDEAEKRSAAFTQEWAAHGAAPSEPNTNRLLAGAARNARSQYDSARIAAQGAQAGLPSARARLEQAHGDLQSAQSRVGTAAAQVLAATLEPELVRAEQAGREFTEALSEVLPGLLALSGRWHSFSSDAVALAMLERLSDALPTLPASLTDLRGPLLGPALTSRSRDFVELGERLLGDPDAS